MQKKVPIRMCVACRSHIEKNNLIRIIKTSGGNLAVDKTKKADCRGAYLCNSVKCLELALKKKAFERTFKMPVGEQLTESIRQEVKQFEASNGGAQSHHKKH